MHGTSIQAATPLLAYPQDLASSANQSSEAPSLSLAAIGSSTPRELASLNERVEQLEALLEEQQAAAEKKKAEASGKPTLKINGRIHLDAWSFPETSPGIGYFEHPAAALPDFGQDPDDRIFFRRIRLRFQGEAFETMVYRMQIDWNSADSGEMKDMYIGFKELPVLGTLLIGNQKRPLGLDHLNSSRFNIFIERPLVIEAFNEDARRIGIASYNHTSDESYAWCIGSYLMENVTLDGEYIGDTLQASGNARLVHSPWYDEACDGRNYVHFAIAGMLGHPDGDADPTDANSNEGRFRTRSEVRSQSRWLNTGRIPGADWYEVAGVESIVNLGPLQFVGEYQSTWLQRDDETVGTGPDLHFHGAYCYVSYMLTGEHVPYNRTSGTIGRVEPRQNFFLVDSCNDGVAAGWGAWQLAVRYSYLDLTDQDIAGGVENNVSFGLVWYFNPYSSMQFNAVYGDIENHEAVEGFTDGHFTALGTRLRIDF
ncbi:OprO/OprP family phosphate-selective porin [Aeoliella mucimassa]|nr:porin [Aeoliella mucimassa]